VWAARNRNGRALVLYHLLPGMGPPVIVAIS